MNCKFVPWRKIGQALTEWFATAPAEDVTEFCSNFPCAGGGGGGGPCPDPDPNEVGQAFMIWLENASQIEKQAMCNIWPCQ